MEINTAAYKQSADSREERAVHHETYKRLWALKKLNKSLIEGIKLAIFVLEKEEELTEEGRRTMVEALEDLIVKSEEA